MILQGDCLEFLGDEWLFPARSVDAIITDPPYCSGGLTEAGRTGAKYQGLRSEVGRDTWFVGDNMGTAGLAHLLRSMAYRATRICKPSASMLIFCDWRMACNIIPAVESAGVRFQNLIVWDKGGAGLGNGFRPQHELIAHFTFGAPVYHSNSASNVLSAKRVRAQKEHPTQKPVELMDALLRVVTGPDGLIVDPFCGSGTTGVAALSAGRRFIGIDRDPNFCSVASRRILETAETARVDSAHVRI